MGITKQKPALRKEARSFKQIFGEEENVEKDEDEEKVEVSENEEMLDGEEKEEEKPADEVSEENEDDVKIEVSDKDEDEKEEVSEENEDEASDKEDGEEEKEISEEDEEAKEDGEEKKEKVSDADSDVEIVFSEEDEEAVDDKEEKKEVEEHFQALFKGAKLSEGYKAKAKTIFESAVKAQVARRVKLLEAKATKKVIERVKMFNEQTAKNVDKYVSYVAEDWTKQNAIALEAGIRMNVMESFTKGVKKLFEDHNIDIPAEKVSLVSTLSEENRALAKRVNQKIEENISLRSSLEKAERKVALNEAANGLALTQVSKLAKLAEGIDAKNIRDYKTKLSIIKEQYFGKKIPATSEIKEAAVIVESAETPVNNSVSKYAQFISERTKN